MIRLLLGLCLVLASAGTAHAQCTPDPLYADSVFGIWPDTIQNFPIAQVDVAYFAQVDIVVPENTGDVPGLDLPFDLPIDSGAILDIQNLPPGLEFACNSQTPAECTYLPSTPGCAVITGTPTETGTFVLDISLRAYLNFFGVVTEDRVFSGYRIVVSDSAVSILENGPLDFVNQNAPNPFSTSTRIDYRLDRSAEIEFTVMDMLGQEVYSERRQGLRGRNSFSYSPEGLREGIYLYSIATPEGRLTRRMVYRPE